MIGTSTQGSSAHESLARAAHDERTGVIRSFYGMAARLDRVGFGMLRLGLVVVLCWIGGLKAANYEAEGIVPFVANSPFMNFFYRHLSFLVITPEAWVSAPGSGVHGFPFLALPGLLVVKDAIM